MTSSSSSAACLIVTDRTKAALRVTDCSLGLLVKTSSIDEEEAVERFCLGLIDFSRDEHELFFALGDGCCFWILDCGVCSGVTLALGDFEAAVDLRPELGDFELEAAFRAGLGELVGLIELNKSLATLLAKRL